MDVECLKVDAPTEVSQLGYVKNFPTTVLEQDFLLTHSVRIDQY